MTAHGRDEVTAHGRDGRRLALAGVAVVAVLHAWLLFGLLEPDALHSLDMAVKYVQARTLLDNRFLTLGLANRGAFIDPAGDFFPFQAPFVFHTPAGWQSIFPTGGTLVHAPVSPLGLTGMILPAFVGGIVLLWTTWRLARDVPVAWALPLVLGLATMLWFYTTLQNEHAPSAAFTTAALGVALWSTRSRALWTAGLLLGAASVLREESLLVAPGLVAARYLAGVRAVRPLARDAAIMGVATLAPLAFVAVLDIGLYHRPVSAHLLHVLEPVQRWLPAESVKGLPALPVLPWDVRVSVVFDYWLLGAGTSQQKLAAVAALIAAALVLWRTGSGLALLAVVAVLAWPRLADVATLVGAPKFVAGLYRLSPFVLFAVVPLPAGVRPSRARRLALVTSACYVVIALLTVNTEGGKSLGPRLLFPLLPLLTLAAWEGIVRWTERLRAGRVEGLLGVVGAALLAAAVVLQGGSTAPAWVVRNQGDALALERVRAAGGHVIVIDNAFSMQTVSALYFERVIMLVSVQPQAADLAGRLAAARVPAFTRLSREPAPALDFAPYVLAAEERDPGGRMVVQHWRR